MVSIMTRSDPKIIVALDYPNEREALNLAEKLCPEQCRVKVGKELYTATGPRIIRELTRLGFEIFLDLKFHDIPNTTARACAVAADMGVWMVNVHASGGGRMLEKCVQTLDGYGAERPLLVGVTVLTSLSGRELSEIGISRSLEEQVLLLAKLCERSGLDGVVCSAQEAEMLRRELPPSFQLVTPGIRQNNMQADDQKRTMTPVEALKAGVSYLVVGRPITQSPDPVAALRAMYQEISA